MKRVPMYLLDWAAAILEQVPRRALRKPGRPKQDAVQSVEFWAQHGSNVAEAARMVATLEARKREEDMSEDEIQKRADEDVSEDEIQKRAEDLARQVYRRRKPDVT